MYLICLFVPGSLSVHLKWQAIESEEVKRNSKVSSPASVSDKKVETIKRRKMERSASTNADKPRTAWCQFILKTKNCLEVNLLWKESRNTIKLYQTVKEKKEFGRIKSVEVKVSTQWWRWSLCVKVEEISIWPYRGRLSQSQWFRHLASNFVTKEEAGFDKVDSVTVDRNESKEVQWKTYS